ncbi:hypothetical protein [Oceanobacillus halotolerans]|uniref:hypothetical protein n=1 Tax=Oceanobacillus halotolerans TaxID=2663380 RepID=UPI0013DC06D9|nr:hypothetical protein [Oceanobacillus halotolerans]
MESLRCANCGQIIAYSDAVCLDVLNSITHKKCYDLRFALKDTGTFQDIVNKYSFFKELRE